MRLKNKNPGRSTHPGSTLVDASACKLLCPSSVRCRGMGTATRTGPANYVDGTPLLFKDVMVITGWRRIASELCCVCGVEPDLSDNAPRRFIGFGDPFLFFRVLQSGLELLAI